MDSDSSEEVNVETKKILKVKYDLTYDSIREILFCEHKTDTPCPEKPLMRTLFLSKVPPWATEDGLERIFGCNGKIKKVYLSQKASSSLLEEESRNYSSVDKYLWPAKDTTGFKYAFVVFEKPMSVKKALNSMDLSQTYIMCSDENPSPTGVKLWKRQYNEGIVPEDQIDDLKKAIEQFVHDVDVKRAEARDQAEEEAEPDNDGWVTVSTKSRKKSTLGAGKSEKVRARMKAREAKRKRNKELRNFYKFQAKEGKLKKLQDLRDRFEADKEKQRKLIAERKFRPQR